MTHNELVLLAGLAAVAFGIAAAAVILAGRQSEEGAR